MFFLPPITSEQDRHWQAFLDRMRAIEMAERDGADPWLFHGTSAIRAAWIRREGFRPSSLLIQADENPARPGDPLAAQGVNWGTLNVAAWAAGRAAANDDPPAILAARLSALARAGALVPDHYALGTGCTGGRGIYDDRPYPDGEPPADPDWREGLRWSGAIGVVGCARVAGMTFHEPLRDVPVHPDWEEARRRRGGGRGSYAHMDRLPPRGMPEPTPRTHPPSLTSEACFAQGLRATYGTDSLPAGAPVTAGPGPAMAP